MIQKRRIYVYLRRILNLKNYIDIEQSIESVRKNIEFAGPNVWILFLACLIASVGLNVNSIPVIIGAMLVSPLMGPITGVGLALGINDSELLRKSLKNLLVMVIISLIASFTYFLLTPLRMESPTELLARTNPTIYDVFIALFGGLAGIIEVCRKEKGTVISGVAIATALMPPLCTAGYGLASGNMIYFLGAIYLFFINSVFIAMASYLMVRYLKFPLAKFNDPVKEKKVKRRISLFTLILIIPSIYSAFVTVKENNFNQKAKAFVAENKYMDRSYIYEYHIDHHKSPSELKLMIGGEKLSDNDLKRLFLSMEKFNIDKKQLVIEQNTAMLQSGMNENMMMQEFLNRTEREAKEKDDKLKALEDKLSEIQALEIPYDQISREITAQFAGIENISISRGQSKDIKSGTLSGEVVVVLDCSREMPKEEMEKMNRWLEIRIGSPVRIIQNQNR